MKKILPPFITILLAFLLLTTGCTNPLSEQLVTETPAENETFFLQAAPDRGLTGTPEARNKSNFTANVMAPLRVTNWNDFENQLSIAQSMGVDAVSVDIWWGDVEHQGDQQFNWSYYDTIFQKITQAGLNIVPIMSFHQCGGNVGDDYTAYLPPWIWNHYTGQGISDWDLKYVSETGAASAEYISLWADDYVMEQYIQFMDAFENHFADYAGDIDELNISGGTAGELRYPSYNGHDWGGYPNRGTLQAYGSLAIEDFQNTMAAKYGSLANLNSAWNCNLTSFSQVQPPSDASYFFTSYDYKNSQYGRDFFDWYSQSLIEHGKRIIQAAETAFDDQMAAIDLGIKIPGIHWTINDPSYPRLAELTAGLIRTSLDNDSAATGHGYLPIVSTAASGNRGANLHFTCLEMGNENSAPSYSQAENLVFWVAAAADSAGVTIKGENALAGGVTTHYGWDKINNALTWASYEGLTVLRMEQVTWNNIGRDRFTQVIQQFATPNPVEGVTIHYNEFESASGYSLHAWNGLSGDYPLTYEGEFNGQHWWSVTLEEAPANFSFCFVNSKGNWDGANRQFSGQGDEIYTLPYSSQVTTWRP